MSLDLFPLLVNHDAVGLRFDSSSRLFRSPLVSRGMMSVVTAVQDIGDPLPAEIAGNVNNPRGEHMETVYDIFSHYGMNYFGHLTHSS